MQANVKQNAERAKAAKIVPEANISPGSAAAEKESEVNKLIDEE